MLTGRTVVLRHLNMSDYDPLYHLTMSGTITTWRNLARSVPPEQFQVFLWDGVHTQRVICRRDDPAAVVGLVSLFNEHPQNQVAYFSIVVDPDAPDGAGGEAAALFLRFVFEHTGLRKIYAETSELSLPLLAQDTLLPGVVEEGRLRGHVQRGGTAYDLVVLAMYRESFLAANAPVFRLLDRDLDVRRPAALGPTWRQFLVDVAASFPFLKTHLGGDIESVEGGLRLIEDLQVDSLMLVEIVAWAEDTYGVAVGDDQLSGVVTLQDAFEAIAPCLSLIHI